MGILRYPPYLQWEVCSECNHKCVHCYNYWRASNISVEKCADYDLIAEKIIERRPLYVAITGGEPLLVFPHIKPAIDKLINSGISVSISTNGTLITKDIAEYLSQRKIDLVISLPSINEQICDMVTCGHDVVKKLKKVLPLLKQYSINTNINIVINKLNLSTLYDTLVAVGGMGFVTRVGVAQRPINASKEYSKYEINKTEFNTIVQTCLKAKREHNIDLDFSVCLPDCAFDDEQAIKELGKGDCLGGTLAYAICANGDVKACQCDTMVYGNILKDSWASLYQEMISWRNSSMIPELCKSCSIVNRCRGGCRVESYARDNDYSKPPTFFNSDKHFDVDTKVAAGKGYKSSECFILSDNVVFLKDENCYRVSVGIIPTFLSFELVDWLKCHKSFSYQELADSCEIAPSDLNLAIELMIKNLIIKQTH